MNTIINTLFDPHTTLYPVLRTSFELDYKNAMNLTYARHNTVINTYS